jgi:DNA modification methylase
MQALRVCNSAFEFVFVFSKQNNSRAIGTREFRGTVSNVFDCSPQRKNDYASEHAATFSVEFVSHYIDNFTNKGEIVADFFGGTGTTLIACEQLGRKCRMMELDPHYCDVIIARWEKLTGKTAKKIN